MAAAGAAHGGSMLTVLGAGSILPRAGYGPAGYALRTGDGPITLLDCGPGSLRALGAAGLPLESVRRVLLTHFHPDHCLDLLALFFARRNPALRGPGGGALPSLEVVGPRGLGRWVDAAAEAFGRWVADPDLRLYEAEADFEVGTSFRTGERDGGALELRCALTGHTPDALAWRVELPSGDSLVFSGDTGESSAVAELARGATVFLCECSFPEEAATPHHLTPAGAGRLARAAGCRELVLTHFYPSLEPEDAVREARAVWGGPTSAAYDGRCIGLGD